MSTSWIYGVLAVAACTSASGDPAASRTSQKPASTSVAAAPGPIVVELFTSQGCSSCPPADRVLSQIASDGVVGKRAVVPLAFHVDYWNDLGWADPFSTGSWTERQRRYAEVLGAGRVYTPELVIAGRADVVGSDRTGVTTAIAAAPLPARLDAAIEWKDRTARVSATAPAGADAWVAIYEDALTTTVERGENAGETLRNDHIVRRFEKIAGAGEHATVDVALDPSWKQLGAVVIAQGKDMAIVGTRALAPR